ncbi:MAG: hypothetical protein MZV64_59915 [Ignavibacteriales bacterium]|nr:hypothetical protein [Ignavibacteriales bacterium]
MITGRPLGEAKDDLADLLGHDARRVRSRSRTLAGRQSASHRFRSDPAYCIHDLAGGPDEPRLQSKRTD